MDDEATRKTLSMRILVKSIRVPEGRRSAFLRIPIRWTERSDAGELIVAEVIGMVKRVVAQSDPQRSGGWRLFCFSPAD